MLSCVIHVLCLTPQKGMALILAIPFLSYLLLLTFVEFFLLLEPRYGRAKRQATLPALSEQAEHIPLKKEKKS